MLTLQAGFINKIETTLIIKLAEIVLKSIERLFPQIEKNTHQKQSQKLPKNHHAKHCQNHLQNRQKNAPKNRQGSSM